MSKKTWIWKLDITFQISSIAIQRRFIMPFLSESYYPHKKIILVRVHNINIRNKYVPICWHLNTGGGLAARPARV